MRMMTNIIDKKSSSTGNLELIKQFMIKYQLNKKVSRSEEEEKKGKVIHVT